MPRISELPQAVTVDAADLLPVVQGGVTKYAAAGALPSTAVAASLPGVVQVDSFAGATDADKMNAALSYAAAQTRAPWLQLPARVFNTGAATFSMFTGLKIAGPGFGLGPMNEEIASGKGVAGKWQTSCGSGASSLLQATSTVNDVTVAGVTFHGGSGSQIFRSTVNLYPGRFHELTLYGGKHLFGSPAEKFLMTQVSFTGHWTVLSYTDTPITVGGGDCSLWMAGYINSNSPTATAGAGKPVVILDGLGKSDCGFLYITAENDWTGLQIKGAADKSVKLFGGVYEGRSQTNLATRPVVDVQGGSVTMYSPHIGQVSGSSGTVSGAVHQSGGTLTMYSPLYWRGSAVAASFPLLYQTGGTARVYHPVAGVAGEQIRVRWSSGTTDTAALHSNGVTA